MATRLTRRDFLKLGGLAASSAGYTPFQPNREDRPDPDPMGRVTINAVSIYKEPHPDATIVGQRFRDELIPIYYEVRPPDGPAYNPLWYRVWGGYAHSSHIQRVETRFHKPRYNLRPTGQLFEVSVPFITSLQKNHREEWFDSTRLYYQSTHWATAIEDGPDGSPWYRLTSELWDVDYYVPATHVRMVSDEELTPISPEVPPEQKRILVNLKDQTLTAFESGREVLHTTISSGLPDPFPTPGEIPTETPLGRFNIQVKLPSKHMGQGRLTDDLEDFVLLGVPWTSFFTTTGVALHGTYWHNNFGWQMSHGCVNMRNHEAKWIYRWTTPQGDPEEWEHRGRGTVVEVVK
ncbi:MAG: L,D-transpeptidase [Anaerolineales bacterium]|nr:L,D-transpeptidase [Anaerolineales bacterium]